MDLPMGTIYFDESIHDSDGFILGSYVYTTKSIEQPVAEALHSVGLVPGKDEFKSGAYMQGKPQLQDLRNKLIGVVGKHSQIGLLVAGRNERGNLGREALLGLLKIVEKNSIVTEGLSIFFDKGIFASESQGKQYASRFPALAKCQIFFEQDSKSVLGLQLADLIAHSGALMLSEQLNGTKKTIPLGEKHGYEEGTTAEFGWVLRMTFRYNFFAKPKAPLNPDNLDAGLLFDWYSYGIYTSENLPENIKAAVHAVFNDIWMGCIH